MYSVHIIQYSFFPSANTICPLDMYNVKSFPERLQNLYSTWLDMFYNYTCIPPILIVLYTMYMYMYIFWLLIELLYFINNYVRYCNVSWANWVTWLTSWMKNCWDFPSLTLTGLYMYVHIHVHVFWCNVSVVLLVFLESDPIWYTVEPLHLDSSKCPD